MKKRHHLFIVLFSASAMLTIISGFVYPVSGEEPVVTWVYMEDAEPISWEEDGVAKGVEVEIVSHIMSNLGIRVIHKFYPWPRAQQYFAEGKVDAMMTTPTAERFKFAVFGKENALPNYMNLFYKKGNIEIAEAVKTMSSLEDLKPYRLIDYIGNGWTSAFLKDRGDYDIFNVPRIEQIPLMIAQGRCDLVVNESSWINWWAEKKNVHDNIEEFEINWEWTRFHFVTMVSRSSIWMDKGLVRAMDMEIKKMKDSGVWFKILEKYKNPHGIGKPFRSWLDSEYETAQGFYTDYNSYPVYNK